MLESVHRFIQKHALLKQNTTVIVGLSGGPDSVCLLTLLKKLQPTYNLKLIAAHLDHQWRPTSHEDALFCKHVADSLALQYIQATPADIPLTKDTGSQEDRGRRLRRTFLEKIAKEHSADAIALGHHQDDQQETFFLRLIRGASITGLAGMKPRHGLYIRPLLDCKKESILTYLRTEGLSFLHDSTNEDDSFLRNGIRLNVLPALRSCDGRFETSLTKALAHMRETEEFLERTVRKALQDSTEDLQLNLEQFFSLDPFLHHPVLLAWLIANKVPFTPSTAFFDEIMRFMHTSGHSHQIASSWNLLKRKGSLLIEIPEQLTK